MPRDTKVRALLESAETHTRAGRLARAVRAYRRVLRLTHHGDFAREIAHARLADLHIEQGEAGSAISHLQRAQSLSGGEPEYDLMLGIALLAAGRTEEAADRLYGALQSPAHVPDALAALAETLAELGDRAGAGRLARRAASIAPNVQRFRDLSRYYADA